MQTLQQTYHQAYISKEKTQSIFSQFITWCKGQESYRFAWLAAIIFIHGCVLTPITVLSVALSSNNIIYWVAAMSAMGMALVSNLAAMPTKITIPVFFLSVLIDLVIIAISVYQVFSV